MTPCLVAGVPGMAAMRRLCALALLLLLFSWETAESAKISCKLCKDFVKSFDRVSGLGGFAQGNIISSGWCQSLHV